MTVLGSFQMKLPWLIGMVKHENCAMSWGEHGAFYSLWHDHAYFMTSLVETKCIFWRFLHDSCKILGNYAIFLQNIVRSYKILPILEDSGRLYVSCKIPTRFLQEVSFLQDSRQIDIVCKNLARNKIIFFARIPKNLARDVFMFI